MIRALLRRMLCAIGDHEWTCKAEQGIDPSPQRMAEDPIGYFSEYSRGYCSRCGERMEERRAGVSPGEVALVLFLLAMTALVLTRSPGPVQDAGTWPPNDSVELPGVPPSVLYYGPRRDQPLDQVCCRVLPWGR